MQKSIAKNDNLVYLQGQKGVGERGKDFPVEEGSNASENLGFPRFLYTKRMNYNIKGTGIAVAPELRRYVEKKFGSAEKFIGNDTTAYTNIELEYSQMRDGDKYRAEFTVSASGSLYRAQEWGSTMHAAIDLAIEALVKELRRNKSKHIRLLRRGAGRVKDFMRGFRKEV